MLRWTQDSDGLLVGLEFAMVSTIFCKKKKADWNVHYVFEKCVLNVERAW